jgi:hypothetical protein
MDGFETIRPSGRWLDCRENAAALGPENATRKLTGRFALKYC